MTIQIEIGIAIEIENNSDTMPDPGFDSDFDPDKWGQSGCDVKKLQVYYKDIDMLPVSALKKMKNFPIVGEAQGLKDR